MLMLSFIFVIVCGLFEWKRICACFNYRLFLYYRRRSSYQEGKVRTPLIGLTLRQELDFPRLMSWVLFVFSQLRLEVIVLLILLELLKLSFYKFLINCR